jgi:hypothetical protein
MKNLILALTALASLTLTLGHPAGATIVQIQEMKSIGRYLAPGRTLIVFDFDNTIIEAAQTLGSDQWFDKVVEGNLARGMDKEQATQRAIAVWTQVQRRTQVRAVESVTPAIIRQLQSQGYPVLGLTARPEAVRDVTTRQLASVGVRLRDMLLVGPSTTKGEALRNYLQRSSGRYSRVLFVDDKQKHVDTVNAALNLFGPSLQHFEFRYGAADARVRGFDARVAACQWTRFSQTGVIPSDLQCGGHVPAL